MWLICLWFERIAFKNEQFAQKNSYFLYVFTAFPLFMPKSESLQLLFFQERRVWFSLIALYKRSTMSITFPSLFIKELQTRFALFQEGIALSLFCSQKTSDSLEKPKSEFPTLITVHCTRSNWGFWESLDKLQEKSKWARQILPLLLYHFQNLKSHLGFSLFYNLFWNWLSNSLLFKAAND